MSAMASHTGETEPLLGNGSTNGDQAKLPVFRDLSHLEDADSPDEQTCMFASFAPKQLTQSKCFISVVVEEDVRPVDDGDAKRHLGESLIVANSCYAA